MSRQQFTSRNNIGKILTFQKSGSTSSFDPAIGFDGGGRVSWRLDNGTNITQTAGNGLTYTGFTLDTDIRTIQIRVNSFRNTNSFIFDNDNIYGNLDLTQLSGFSGTFRVNTNPNLTGITNGPSSQIFSTYVAYSCNLTGNLDLTPLSGLGGQFQVNNNPNLTGITHGPSSQNISSYLANSCNLIGNLDLTPLSGLGGQFWVSANINLTGITHGPSSQIFTSYLANSCKLTGNLDLTPLSGFGGQFWVNNNTNLTGITHGPSSQNISSYLANSCNLIGNLDLTPLSGFGGQFDVWFNFNLTGITHSTSPNNITRYRANDCKLTGTLDLRNLTKLGASTTGSTSILRLDGNSSLTNILLPTSTQYFKNESNGLGSRVFSLYGCNLDYINFTSLSGATLVSGTTQGRAGIDLQNNNMTTTDVNHILVDFSGNATYNPTGWSNITLNISGTNADPDSSSGGYNGLAAISFLTGSPYNWTITY